MRGYCIWLLGKPEPVYNQPLSTGRKISYPRLSFLNMIPCRIGRLGALGLGCTSVRHLYRHIATLNHFQ